MSEPTWFSLDDFKNDAKTHGRHVDRIKRQEYVTPIEKAFEQVEATQGAGTLHLRYRKQAGKKPYLRLEQLKYPQLRTDTKSMLVYIAKMQIGLERIWLYAQTQDAEHPIEFWKMALRDQKWFDRCHELITQHSPKGTFLATSHPKSVKTSAEDHPEIWKTIAKYRDSTVNMGKFQVYVHEPLETLTSREAFVRFYERVLPFFNKFTEMLVEAAEEFGGGTVTLDGTPLEDPEETFADDDPEDSPMPIPSPQNLILYGPPGTGKTHRTAEEVVRLLDPQFLHGLAGTSPRDRYSRLKERYDQLRQDKRVGFVTFHQSFSYEDFVEGIRAKTVQGQIQYSDEPGIFTALAQQALANLKGETHLGLRPDARVWKISLDKAGPSKTRDYCLEHGEIRVGWPEVGSFLSEERTPEEEARYQQLGTNTKKSMFYFAESLKIGDFVMCLASNTSIQAVGVVTGEYQHEIQPPDGVNPSFRNVRKVRWWHQNTPIDILELDPDVELSQVTLYPLSNIKASDLVKHIKALIPLEKQSRPVLQYALVIDEINRGNISRIFGELITLLEPSKRYGSPEAQTVTLPYSKREFVVPPNLHVIGTMNTADKSLTRLDIALRRRFTFIEVPPEPKLLGTIRVKGVDINLKRFLFAINKRIELLFDRDHTLGHAYLMHLDEGSTIDDLAETMQNRILPLLQEYFFDNWGNIRRVLRDHKAPQDQQFIIEDTSDGQTWLEESRPITTHRVNLEALTNPLSYTKVYAGLNESDFGNL